MIIFGYRCIYVNIFIVYFLIGFLFSAGGKGVVDGGSILLSLFPSSSPHSFISLDTADVHSPFNKIHPTIR